MQPESAKFLEDIREAAQTILEATARRALDDYLRDKLLRLAVERCFEIAGEALRRLDERDPQTAARITECRRIIGFRNVLIHGYSIVSNERVWRTVQDDVPNLLAEVQSLLAS